MGSGEKEPDLKKRISDAVAEGWFHLAGFQTNPYGYIKNADLFVCPSYQEGLSTAVTEAILLGVPVVSTDVSGAKEILGKNDEYGIVTENSEEGLYIGVRKMLSEEDRLKHYRQKASERADCFVPEHTVSLTEAFFFRIV